MKLTITCTIAICGHFAGWPWTEIMKNSIGIARIYGILYIEVDDVLLHYKSRLLIKCSI